MDSYGLSKWWMRRQARSFSDAQELIFMPFGIGNVIEPHEFTWAVSALFSKTLKYGAGTHSCYIDARDSADRIVDLCLQKNDLGFFRFSMLENDPRCDYPKQKNWRKRFPRCCPITAELEGNMKALFSKSKNQKVCWILKKNITAEVCESGNDSSHKNKDYFFHWSKLLEINILTTNNLDYHKTARLALDV